MEKNASILVVDDDKEIADLVEIYLVNDGYQVLKASDGEQCLQTLKEHPEVRMLILDIMMPGIDDLLTVSGRHARAEFDIFFHVFLQS